MSENVQNYNIEAHYSNDMKVKRPKVTSFEAPPEIPKHKLFSDKDASKKMQQINTDIYEGSTKEKSQHEFNRKLYFKIFGGITLATAGIAGIGKIRKWLAGRK